MFTVYPIFSGHVYCTVYVKYSLPFILGHVYLTVYPIFSGHVYCTVYVKYSLTFILGHVYSLLYIFRSCLLYSLRQVQFTLDFVENLGLEVKWHGKAENEAAHYCNVCEVNHWVIDSDIILLQLNLSITKVGRKGQPLHEKTNNLHRRKQRRRSASQKVFSLHG